MHREPIAGLPNWRHLAVDRVDSTNSEALRLAVAGEPDGLWITARSQSAGRGRRGRIWASEPGNLHASLLLVDPAPAPALANLPLVAALAAWRALRQILERVPAALSIKWPNDILVDGAKISGVLLESTAVPGGRMAVVIGWGINCAHHPETAMYPATNLAACGFSVTPEEMFLRLAAATAASLAEWNRGAGFGETRLAWRRAAHGLGQQVELQLPEGPVAGWFEDIDPEGHLCLRQPDGVVRRIFAGDLFFRN